MVAAEKGNLAVCDYLIRRGANISLTDYDGTVSFMADLGFGTPLENLYLHSLTKHFNFIK